MHAASVSWPWDRERWTQRCPLGPLGDGSPLGWRGDWGEGIACCPVAGSRMEEALEGRAMGNSGSHPKRTSKPGTSYHG